MSCRTRTSGLPIIRICSGLLREVATRAIPIPLLCPVLKPLPLSACAVRRGLRVRRQPYCDPLLLHRLHSHFGARPPLRHRRCAHEARRPPTKCPPRCARLPRAPPAPASAWPSLPLSRSPPGRSRRIISTLTPPSTASHSTAARRTGCAPCPCLPLINCGTRAESHR